MLKKKVLLSHAKNTRLPGLLFGLFFCLSAVGTAGNEPFEKKTIDKQLLLGAYKEIKSSDRKLAGLTTYDQMVVRLEEISQSSNGKISVGPIVRSDDTGILPSDIDLMNQIIDTVPDMPGFRKNTVENFGLSTQGRPIMAARAGNRQDGRKVMIIAQQHGNEVSSTEAVLDYLYDLATSKDPAVEKILSETDLLFIVRANPDGGEPDEEKCLMADKITLLGEPLADGSVNCALQRWNVDHQAGFLTLLPANDLYGAAFLGFDPNRYHYALLDGPIYPVETQAMVYALKKFAPEFLVDLHNQNTKIRCRYSSDAEYETCREGAAGEVIDGAVQSGSITIPPMDADIQIRAERMGAHLLAALNKNCGTYGRFAQVSSTLPPASRTTVDAAMELGIVANWIEVALNEEVIGYTAISRGRSTILANLGMPQAAKLQQAISCHKIGIHEYLQAVADGIGDAPGDNGGYDTNPAWDPPNFDRFIISAQILLQLGLPTESYADDPRVVISEIR